MAPVSKRRFSIVLAAVMIFALALGAVLPALAQSQSQQCVSPYSVQQGDTLQSIAKRCGVTEAQLIQANPNISLLVDQQLVIPQGQAGQSTGASQANTSVTISSNETLGSLLGRYQLTEKQVQDYLVGNAGLNVQAGQTVTFPEGVTVNMGQSGQASQATGTPAATQGTGAATSVATGTPAATQGAGTGTSVATGTPAATESAGAGAGQATATVQATPSAQTTSSAQATEKQAGQGNFVCARGTTAAGETYTTQANDTLGDLLTMMGLDVSSATDTTTQSGQVTANQVVDLVYLNCDLAFENDQTAMVPTGSGIIPQTGGQQASIIPQPRALADVPGAAGIYTLGPNETLSHVALRYNTTIDRLLELNPQIQNRAIVYPGQQILVPDRNEGLGQQGQTQQSTATSAVGAGAATQTPLATSTTAAGAAVSTATSAVGSATSTPLATSTTAAVATQTPLATSTTAAGAAVSTATSAIGAAGAATATPLATSTTAAVAAVSTATSAVSAATATPLATSTTAVVATQTPLVTSTTAAVSTATSAAGAATATPQATSTTAAGAATQAPQATQTSQPVVVQTGETITQLATRLGVTVQQLLNANPNLVLDQGQSIQVPGRGSIPQTGNQGQGQTGQTQSGRTAGLNLNLTQEDVPAGFMLYIVQGGDNLSSVARKFNTTPQRLLELNSSIANPSLLFSGQHIIVPSNSG